MGHLWAWSVVAAELQLLNYSRGRIEDQLATANLEALDAAEVKPLHQFDETSLRVGER
jgi:hypothetical protein